MGRIIVVMGKSATGKDSIYQHLLKKTELNLSTVLTYTTRPKRTNEEDGKEYFFVDDNRFLDLKKSGKIIELRSYDTMYGIWHYFTVDDGQIVLENSDYLVIQTLAGYEQLCRYFGEESIIPVYIEVEDGLRLERALSRERSQAKPGYAEMCRRFLADEKDFCEENLLRLGITKRYQNVSIDTCVEEIVYDLKK